MYNVRRTVIGKDSDLVVLVGVNSGEINQDLERTKNEAGICKKDCPIIPLFDGRGDSYGCHLLDCTIEIFDDERRDWTYILVSNQSRKKRIESIRELCKYVEIDLNLD
jgi:hypothetical protein